VSDQLHNTTTPVLVHVLDDNDNAPVFTQSSYEVSFSHGTSFDTVFTQSSYEVSFSHSTSFCVRDDHKRRVQLTTAVGFLLPFSGVFLK